MPPLVAVVARRRPTGRAGGFSLIELVMILVITGSLAALALPRLAESDRSLAVQADALAHDVRHVQLMAMNQGRALTLDVRPGTAYHVSADDVLVTDPATRRPYRVELDDDVAVSGGTLRIDSLGRPSGVGALLAAEHVFTLTGRGDTVDVVVSPVTGFVSLSP